MVMAVPAGRLSDRIGRAKVFTFGYAILLALYVVLLSGASSDLLVPATLLGLGIFYASTDGVLAALGSAAVPEAVRGTGLAALGTATGLAQFGASIAFGALWYASRRAHRVHRLHRGPGGRAGCHNPRLARSAPRPRATGAA